MHIFCSRDEEFLGGMSFGVKHIYSMKRVRKDHICCLMLFFFRYFSTDKFRLYNYHQMALLTLSKIVIYSNTRWHHIRAGLKII